MLCCAVCTVLWYTICVGSRWLSKTLDKTLRDLKSTQTHIGLQSFKENRWILEKIAISVQQLYMLDILNCSLGSHVFSNVFLVIFVALARQL